MAIASVNTHAKMFLPFQPEWTRGEEEVSKGCFFLGLTCNFGGDEKAGVTFVLDFQLICSQ